MNRYYWLGLIFLLVGCRTPHITNYPEPDLEVNFNIFENVDCPPDQYGFRKCQPGSPLADLGCDQIKKPVKYLGALDPSYPIALCLMIPDQNMGNNEEQEILNEGKYFFKVGGMLRTYIRYVIYHEGQFKLIKTEQEFRSVFAPIETPQEALSYGLAVRDLSAYYNQKIDPNYQYFVDQFQDTYVEEVAGGYQVHLFFYEEFGCGPHLTYAVAAEITHQGDVKELNREAIYKNPSHDDLCVD